MTSKSTKGIKATAAGNGAAAQSGQGTELDFNDTITRNRSLKLLDIGAIPRVPQGFRGTDPVERQRRIRWLSSDLRAEAKEALREGGSRDLQAELGQFAPEPQRALVLAERVTHTGEMVVLLEALLAYAKEVDQIAMSDALMFLEAVRKQYLNAVDHSPTLATSYHALMKLFDMRSGAIAEGIAQAKVKVAASPAAEVEKAAAAGGADAAVKAAGK